MGHKHISKKISYIALSAALWAATGASAADVTKPTADPALRTQVKSSLKPIERPAQDVAESVGKAIAAEILSSGFNTELLKHRLETTPKPSKVAALESADEPAPGQADQT